MGLKIEATTAEELEQEFGTSTSGNDPETVTFIRALDIGGGFKVEADSGETDRMVKRRINACAKEAFRELDWRTRTGGGLTARVKSIDAEAQKKWQAEQDAKAAEAKAKAEAEAKAKAEAEATKNPPAGGESSNSSDSTEGTSTSAQSTTQTTRGREKAAA